MNEIQLRIAQAPHDAMKHDDHLADWLAIAACAFSAFVFSDVKNATVATGSIVLAWFSIVAFLGSAILGLLSRLAAGEYFRMCGVVSHFETYIDEKHIAEYEAELIRMAAMLPAWYSPIFNLRRRLIGEPVSYLVRTAFWQGFFSELQKLSFLLALSFALAAGLGRFF